MGRVINFPDPSALTDRCLDLFRETFPVLGEKDGLMLSGGRTPLALYRRIADEGLTAKGSLFLSDERYVPALDPQSNYGAVSGIFKNGKSAPSLSLLKIKTDLPLEQAARMFHDDLKKLEAIPLGLLGLGSDGHTASLFTRRDAALRDERLAIPVVRERKPDRISVTPALLHRIEKIILLVTGEEKKGTVETLIRKPETIPAGIALASHPNVEVWTVF